MRPGQLRHMPRPFYELLAPRHVTFVALAVGLWFVSRPLVPVARALCARLTLACESLMGGGVSATNIVVGAALLGLSVLVHGVFSLGDKKGSVNLLRDATSIGEAYSPLVGALFIGCAAALILMGCIFVWWWFFVYSQKEVLDRPLSYAAGVMVCYIVGGVIVDHVWFVRSLFCRKMAK